ncbi:porin PorA family protein [Candidatus Frankia alpina]|nr:porin PorA family protein [Candidatus Frankia alpina]
MIGTLILHETRPEEALMPIRRSAVVLGTLGILSVVLGLLLKFVLVPVLTKLPGSTDLGITYSGTGTLLNSQALQSGDTKHVIASNVPITVGRRLKVTSTHGDTAIVSDNLTIHAGTQALPSNHTYALDRTSLKGTTASKGTTVEPSKGALSSTFPIGPKAGNAYHFYDSTTRNIVPLRYAGHDKIRGRSLNVYTVAATGPVKDPGLLKMLPPALPKKLFAGLASLLPADVRAKATPATLAALPDPVPFTYTGITHITADVDRQTGVPINEHINEQVVANITAGGQTLSLIPVLALDFQITPASEPFPVTFRRFA